MVGVVLACLPVSTAATLTAAPAAAAPDIPVSLEGVHGSPSPTDYWLASTSGQVWAMGDAGDYGGLAAAPAAPVVGIAPTGDKHGYWLVARDGGIFSFGDAAFYGSTGSLVLNQPVVGMAPTPDGKGYWLVARDGGIFSFGDAAFYGSTGGLVLNQPVVGMAPTPEGKGYWLIAADGGIFSFGDAAFYGSMGATPTPDPAQEVVTTSSGHGYWIVDQNGTAWAFGDAGPTPPVQGLLFRPVTPGDGAVLFAFAQLGKPYIWGGNGPVGYDCSGLALAAWVSVGVSFARVSDDQYHTAGVPMSLADLQAGDLVFWGSDESDWTTVDHTAIYVGGGRIVEATGDQVQLNSLSQWGTAEVMPIGRHP
ncbi:MAG: C40 family peptidase [Acidimicrobiales bacterium]